MEPSPTPKVTRLPRNGPKVGQSYEQWARGKSIADKRWEERKKRYSWRQMKRRNTEKRG